MLKMDKIYKIIMYYTYIHLKISKKLKQLFRCSVGFELCDSATLTSYYAIAKSFHGRNSFFVNTSQFFSVSVEDFEINVKYDFLGGPKLYIYQVL